MVLLDEAGSVQAAPEGLQLHSKRFVPLSDGRVRVNTPAAASTIAITLTTNTGETPASSVKALDREIIPAEKFSGYVYVECNMTPESIRKMAEPLNYDRFYADAIYICYKQQTGEAFVHVGERTGLTLKDAAAVEAAFQPGEDSEDSSGFAAGIISLSNALTDDVGPEAIDPLRASLRLGGPEAGEGLRPAALQGDADQGEAPVSLCTWENGQGLH